MPSGLMDGVSVGTDERSEFENIVSFAALVRIGFDAKFIDSSGIVDVCWPMGCGRNIRPFLLRVRRECTSLDVSWSAARMMIIVGVMACIVSVVSGTGMWVEKCWGAP